MRRGHPHHQSGVLANLSARSLMRIMPEGNAIRRALPADDQDILDSGSAISISGDAPYGSSEAETEQSDRSSLNHGQSPAFEEQYSCQSHPRRPVRRDGASQGPAPPGSAA
jgi:hypothetical protein